MYTRLKYGGDGLQYNYSVFLCDSVEDISTLPKNTGKGVTCSVGSKAFIADGSESYILSNSGEWVIDLTSSSSGGSGGDISKDNIASLDETKEYIGI